MSVDRWELTSIDSHEVLGRGTIYVIAGIQGFNPRALVLERVTVDGRAARVRGVETFALVDPSGFPFGLLLEWLEPVDGEP